MRGKGLPKMFFFLVNYCLPFFLPRVPQNWFICFYNFWVQFWVPFFGVLEFFGCLLGAFLGLLILFWEALRAKKRRMSHAKTTFVKMQFFGSLKLLMVLLGSSWSLLGRSGPRVGPNMGSKGSRQVNSKMLKNDDKTVQFWPPKLAPKIVLNEIAGLRHFLPSKHL